MQDSQLLAYFLFFRSPGCVPVSCNMDSCSIKSGKKKFPFIPIDTPGLNEPTPLKDSVGGGGVEFVRHCKTCQKLRNSEICLVNGNSRISNSASIFKALSK